MSQDGLISTATAMQQGGSTYTVLHGAVSIPNSYVDWDSVDSLQTGLSRFFIASRDEFDNEVTSTRGGIPAADIGVRICPPGQHPRPPSASLICLDGSGPRTLPDTTPIVQLGNGRYDVVFNLDSPGEYTLQVRTCLQIDVPQALHVDCHPPLQHFHF